MTKITVDGVTIEVVDGNVSINTIDNVTPSQQMIESMQSAQIDVAHAQFEQNSDHYTTDPVYYMNGNNGMSIYISVSQAVDRVFDMFGEYAEYFDDKLLYDGCATIIRRGDGRQSCYALAGKIASARRAGFYRGLKLPEVFKLAAEGSLTLA